MDLLDRAPHRAEEELEQAEDVGPGADTRPGVASEDLDQLAAVTQQFADLELLLGLARNSCWRAERKMSLSEYRWRT
jgi:hypothetical protein